MSFLACILAGIGALVGSALLALALAHVPRVATRIATSGAVAGCALAAWASISALAHGWEGQLSVNWHIPGGAIVVGIDPLSAFFLAPVLALGMLCSFYGAAYLGARVMPAALLNLLLGAMATVLLARHAMLFIFAWEAMTLLAYTLVTLDHHEEEVRRAGWVYLIASHVALVALIAFFLALGAQSDGALGFSDLAEAGPSGKVAAGLLTLALLGFGIKAGVIGLHVWLPEAHAAAPSHVSALMSGALVKVGVYGLLRAALLVEVGAGFGDALMILGLAGAFAGIALALNQRDLKRALAYSTVENVGIILVALGLGFRARAQGESGIAALAFGGAVLHVWNHAAMKGLLFLGAGNIVHGAGSRNLDRLGGLLRRMPWTGRTMAIGLIAIAALPPLNGFSGEWLLYGALARAGTTGAAPANLASIAGAAALGLIGGLAALCFVRLLGAVLLGVPRTREAADAHEAPWTMTAPLVILAAGCVAGALLAPRLVAVPSALLLQLGGVSVTDIEGAVRHLQPTVLVDSALLLGIALGMGGLLFRVRRGGSAETWGCGYAAPTARMQYTASGFSELVSAEVLPRWFRPVFRVRPPQGPFPAAARFVSETSDPLTRRVYEPFLIACGARFQRLRFLQQGNVHVYIVYILATAIAGLIWVAARDFP